MAARERLVVRGRLALAPVRRGTGSAQAQALVLDTDGGERLLLVRLGGPSFGLPPEAALAGQRVEAEGWRLDGELRFERLTTL